MASAQAKEVEREMAALIEAGVNPLDADAALTWALALLPAGVALADWVPSPETMQISAEVTRASIADARAAWYADDAVPARFKRLLDASLFAADHRQNAQNIG
jgi:hypothetical protein